MRHPRGHDLQRPAVGHGGIQPKVQLILAVGQPLRGSGLECRHFAVVVG